MNAFILLAAIAIIDTGVDLPSKVVHAESFAHSGIEDIHGHGTRQALVALETAPPSTEIVSLRVMDDNRHIFGEYYDAALMWVALHHQEYDIRAVTCSFGGYPTTSIYWPRNLTWDLICLLRELGIPVCCSAGNQGLEGMGLPAIYPETVSVGAFDPKHWWLTEYTNRLAYQTDIFADGEWRDANGNRWTGTSIANARIAGICLVLQDTIERKGRRVASVDDIEDCLRWKRGQKYPMYYEKYALKRAKKLSRRAKP